MMAPKSRHDGSRDAARGSVFKLRLDRLLDLVGQRRVVGDQDRLRAGVVLGLRQQIGGDPVGIAGLVGDDQHLEGPAIMSMPTVPNTTPLGGGDIGIAGADDLGHRRDGLGAVSERGHRLRAADAIDLRRRRRASRPPAPAG